MKRTADGNPGSVRHIGLARQGEPIERIRAGIGTDTPYRRRVLLDFDLLRLRRRKGPLTRELCGEVLRLLSKGWTQPQVARKLGICWLRVARVAWAAEASSWRKDGGRRFTRAQREAIRQAVESGQRPGEILRRYPMSRMTLCRLRREWGDHRDWRRTPQKKKGSTEVLPKLRRVCLAMPGLAPTRRAGPRSAKPCRAQVTTADRINVDEY
jgi:hypothetical protein